jgi:taurine dioxygenase
VSAGVRRLTPPVTHALVCAHPETGDRSLYLDSTTTVGIDYMDTASGVALLDEVYESATRDQFVYAHSWQVGDLVLWDNGFTMHRRTAFDRGARRLMKRMTMRLDPQSHVIPDGRLAQSDIGMPI